ncbi:hypothetical protein T484DRAFT_1612633, partial [Baffinella frigidus]
TLHPTPYTLHPTPYTLHPAPSTLNPEPCTPGAHVVDPTMHRRRQRRRARFIKKGPLPLEGGLGLFIKPIFKKKAQASLEWFDL